MKKDKAIKFLREVLKVGFFQSLERGECRLKDEIEDFLKNKEIKR
jgi:hypothetical protein